MATAAPPLAQPAACGFASVPDECKPPRGSASTATDTGTGGNRARALLVRHLVPLLVDLQDETAALLVAGLSGIGPADRMFHRSLAGVGKGVRLFCAGRPAFAASIVRKNSSDPFFPVGVAKRLDFADSRRRRHRDRCSLHCREVPARRRFVGTVGTSPCLRRRVVLVEDLADCTTTPPSPSSSPPRRS